MYTLTKTPAISEKLKYLLLKHGILGILFFSTISSMAQEPTPLSLSEAQVFAIKNALQVKNSIYDAEVAKLTSDELLGIGLPQVSASLQYQNFITLFTQVADGGLFGAPGQEVRFQFGLPHNMTASLNASQILFNGSWLVGLQASRAYADLQKKNLSKSEIEVKASTSQAYHLALSLQEQLKFTQQTRAVLNQMVDETSALYSAGFVEEQDVEQLQLSLNEITNAIATLESNVRLSEILLKFTIGMPLQQEIKLTDNVETLMNTGEISAVAFSPENNIDVMLTMNALRMQELNLKNKKAAFLPNAALFYNLQSQAFRQQFDFFDTSKQWFAPQLWGFTINMPILSGGSNFKSVQKAKVEVQRMKDTFENVKSATQLGYEQAKTEYDAALKSVNVSQQSLSLSQKILDKTSIKFKEGIASSMSVSQATSQVLKAQSDLSNAKRALLDASVKLKKSLNIL